MNLRTVLAAVLLSSLFATALQADVLIVRSDGAGDFTSVSAAIEAAQEGDILLLQDSFPTELPAILDKRLVIVGDPAASPVVLGGLRILNLSRGKTVVVRGLELGPKPVNGSNAGTVELVGNVGSVLLEDCVIHGLVGQQGALSLHGLPAVSVSASNAVSVVRCQLNGGDGVTLTSAGLPGISPVGIGGAGLNVLGSTVSVFASQLSGGAGSIPLGTFPGSDGGPGIGGFESQIWLEGGHVQGGVGGSGCATASEGCAGGVGVFLQSPVPFFFEDGQLRQRDAQIVGGPGGMLAPPSTETGFPGTPFVADSIAHPGAATLTIDLSPLRAGEPGSLSVHGAVGATAGWLMAFELNVQRLGGNKGVLATGFPLFGPFVLGTIPASGELQFNFTNPSLAGTGLEGLLLIKQALVVDADGLRLGGPSAFIHVGTAPAP